MPITRREFSSYGIGALTALVADASNLLGPESAFAAPIGSPWYQHVRRLGQTNFNERDPEHGNVEAWADYWASTGVQAVLVSVSGPVAFYPTRVPFFHMSKYLNGRDLFGECVAAARKRGMRVIGRMSPDIQYTDPALLAAHPEWFRRDKEGKLLSAAPDIAATCQFTGQYTEQQPAILRELTTRYDIDGIYMNGWPTPLQVCYCNTCRAIGDPRSDQYKARLLDDAVRLVDIYRGIVLEKDKGRFYSCNIAGGMEETEVDLWRLTRNAMWYTADNQARSLDMPVWQAAQQVKFARSLMGQRPVAAASAAYTRSNVTWRQISNTTLEPMARMAQTAAAGGVVWYHQLGLEQGFDEDRRWQRTGREFFSWMAANDRHFENVASLANVAIVVPSRTLARYRPQVKAGRIDHVQGFYGVLNKARIPFDLVHENDLGSERLKPYDVLILPNFAFMSDAQAEALRNYAAAGGSLLATFETGLYDETGQARSDFALADLFGIAKAGPAQGSGDRLETLGLTGSTVQQLHHENPLSAGFGDTNWIAGPSSMQPIKPRSDAVMTYIASYPVYPPEAVYPRQQPTDLPSFVAQERGAARFAYLAGDMDATYWRSDDPDLARQMINAVQWLMRGRVRVSVTGEGLMEVIGWKTHPGYAVHLLNYNSPAAFRGFMEQPVPLGPQAVRFTLPTAQPVHRASLLWNKRELAVRQNGRTIEVTVPGVDLYEVVTLEI